MSHGYIILPGKTLVAPEGTDTGHGHAHGDDCNGLGPGIHCERCEWGVHLPLDMLGNPDADPMLDMIGYAHTFTCHADVTTDWDAHFRHLVAKSVEEMQVLFPPQYFQLRHLSDGTCVHPPREGLLMPAPLQQIIARRVKVAHDEKGLVVTSLAGPGTTPVDFTTVENPMDGTYVHLEDVVAVLEGMAGQLEENGNADAAESYRRTAEWFGLRPL